MSLVELMVVLAVIGLVIGISLPRLTGLTQQLRLKAATRQIVGLLSLARSLAISSREDHAVVIDQERGTLSVVNLASNEPLERVVRLPSTVTIDVRVGGQSSQEARVTFRPSGSLTGRTVELVLADRARTHTITVTGTTGSVFVQ